MNKRERLEHDKVPPDVEPVLFYGGPFSNFSKHSIWLPNPFTGKATLYATGEHRFQAMKGKTVQVHDDIAGQPRPVDAKHAGGACDLRPGWGNDVGSLCWYVMLEVVLHKALQHGEVRRALDATGQRPMYEDSPVDDIWGWRFQEDHRGKNLLGRCWMRTRTILARVR